MNYCVLIHLSRTSISFWYQQQGVPFEPLAKKEGNVVPLYFYVNGNDFVVGKFAQERYLNGDTKSSYGNYFEIVADPSKYFTIFGNQKHVKFLLYYAVEQYLSHFLNSVLYKNESIEEYRNSFPLRFIFSSDIAQKERLLIETIFSESGYDNIETLSFTEFLYSTFINQELIKPLLPVVLLTGIDGNLFIEVFDGKSMNPIDEVIVDEQGADPRIKIMAKMLYENAISTTHFALNEKNEIAHLLTYAKEFLDQQSAIPRGDITLSDGTSFYVQIRKKELNDRLTYDSGEEKIFRAIDNLLLSNNISGNNVQFILNGEAVNTSYFIERLKKKYNFVIGTLSNTQNELLKNVFKSIVAAEYKPLKRIKGTSIETSTNSSEYLAVTKLLPKKTIDIKEPPLLPPPPKQIAKQPPPPPLVTKCPPLPPPPPKLVVKPAPPPPPPKPVVKAPPPPPPTKPAVKAPPPPPLPTIRK